MISGRRTYPDIYLLLAADNGGNKIHFYDANAKLNIRLNENNHLYLSGYFGRDVFRFFDQYENNWGNTTGTLRWNHIFNPNLFANFSLVYSRYDYYIENLIEGTTAFNWESGIEDINAKADFNWYLRPNSRLKFGANAIMHHFEPGRETGGRLPAVPERKTLETAVYLGHKWEPHKRLALEYGLRLSLPLLVLLFSCQEEIELQASPPEPRLVVEGQVTSEYRRHWVKLSQSGDYRGKEPYEKAAGALVTLSDGQATYQLEEVEPGFYLTDSMAGAPGVIYALRVDWEGELYEAADTMRMIPGPFDPLIFVEENGAQTMEYRRHQFGFPGANRWEVIVGPPDTLWQPTYTSSLGQQIGVDVNTAGAYTFNFFTHPNIEVNGLMNFEEAHFYGFRSGRTVTQKRFSLSEAYYQYLRALFLETEWRGTLFDSTPGDVKGNVSNGGLGFFSAQAVRAVVFEI